MQFYKCKVFTTRKLVNNDEQNERIVLRELSRYLSISIEEFNNKLSDKAFYSISDIEEKRILITAIDESKEKFEKHLEDFLAALEIPVKKCEAEETTLSILSRMLSDASNRGFIDDEDQVLANFGLNFRGRGRFFGEGADFGESILEKVTLKNIMQKAENLLLKETLIPEIKRIYKGVTRKKSYGHPVHYIFETDNKENRKEMYKTLLQALYNKGRIQNRRYSFINIEPDDEYCFSFFEDLYKCNAGGSIIVRYTPGQNESDEYAYGSMQEIEDLCTIMKKYSNKVLTIFCFPRECTQIKKDFFLNLADFCFVEIKEDLLSDEEAKNYLIKLSSNEELSPNEELFSKIEPKKLYLSEELKAIFEKWYNYQLKTDIYPQYKNEESVRKDLITDNYKHSAYEELSKMIGLGSAKKVIDEALDYYKAQKLFKDMGMKADRPSMHCVFTGAPGTAKTTVARLFAKILKENDILSKGHLVECGRQDLVGKYVGHTAKIVQQKIKEANGGVLFVDEAYSLALDNAGSFGQEAIDALVQGIENYRESLVVIFAGYPKEMKTFLDTNPGLSSRIAFHVNFDDYNTKELCEIAAFIADKKGFHLTEKADEKLYKIFDEAKTRNDFGNGRYVRNVLEKARMKQASRLLSMNFDEITKEDISTLTDEDITAPEVLNEEKKKTVGFCVGE